MRLWTVHPRYLDAQGLVALWREALLAQAVLREQTRGYRHHPQLARFRTHRAPRAAINAYLRAVLAEADARGYSFDRRKIGPARGADPIPCTTGQLEYEWSHLLLKLKGRNPSLYRKWRAEAPQSHPFFTLVDGPAEPWEKTR
jgi:hypothetical protein